MTREERHALLHPDDFAYLKKRVAEAPDPSDELVEKLRRIFTRPAGEVRKPPAADAA
ncbi:hypothetical protein SGFS_065050 [Streptomyces graminofaciens]|uniref:DUF1778 domain-containing protein n=1 Tax=Streptomyces graminofaciens TaxID=68212 RepID=A0ABN5VPY7_9ACTN|nr:hypothetical protein [Streptomyces graminofaciens]BBC35211.1 hypothetical protein SGFS_065050 [Streptomyces graminofaciens]